MSSRRDSASRHVTTRHIRDVVSRQHDGPHRTSRTESKGANPHNLYQSLRFLLHDDRTMHEYVTNQTIYRLKLIPKISIAIMPNLTTGHNPHMQKTLNANFNIIFLSQSRPTNYSFSRVPQTKKHITNYRFSRVPRTKNLLPSTASQGVPPTKNLSQ